MKLYLEKSTGRQIPPYLLGTMISLYALVSIILSTFELGGLSNQDALRLLLYCMPIIVIQTIISAAMYKYCKKIIAAHIVSAIFTVANIFFFLFALAGGFLLLSFFIKALILAGIFCVYLLTIWCGHRLVVSIATLALVPLIMFKVSTAIIYATDDNSYPLPNDYQFKQFKDKPNIYLLSYDALIPEDMAELYMPDIELDYVDKLKELGAEITADAYASHNTLVTLNSILSVNISWWKLLPSRNRSRLVSGVQNNPVYDLLRGNGYNISLLYRNDYLSRGEKTPIDHYFHHSSLCDLGIIREAIAFWGYCAVMAEEQEALHIRSLFHLFESLYHVVTEDYQNKFVLAYLPLPGHTSTAYSWYNKDSVDAFLKVLSINTPATLYLIETAIAIVRDHDPNAIVMVFGDHGAYFARGRRIDEDGFTEEDQIDDTSKVLLATFNMPECAIKERLDGKLFIHKVVENLMHCLADGDGLVEGGRSDGGSNGSGGHNL